MLSRKKSKNEASKPAEVHGKYVKKETSPLLRSKRNKLVAAQLARASSWRTSRLINREQVSANGPKWMWGNLSWY